MADTYNTHVELGNGLLDSECPGILLGRPKHNIFYYRMLSDKWKACSFVALLKGSSSQDWSMLSLLWLYKALGRFVRGQSLGKAWSRSWISLKSVK